MVRLVIAAALVLGFVTTVEAQQRISFYAVGGATPTATFDPPAASVTCNVTPQLPLPGTPVNPRYFGWDDPANPTTRMCLWDSGAPTTGPIFARPVGDHETTVRFVNAAGAGPESNRVRFNRLDPPSAAPANYRPVPGS